MGHAGKVIGTHTLEYYCKLYLLSIEHLSDADRAVKFTPLKIPPSSQPRETLSGRFSR